MDSIAKYVDERRDVGFMIGFDKGKEKEQIKFITYLYKRRK